MREQGFSGGVGGIHGVGGASRVMGRASCEGVEPLRWGRGYSPGVLLGPDAGLELEAVADHVLGQLVNDRLDVWRRWDDGGGGLGGGLGGDFLFGAAGKIKTLFNACQKQEVQGR